jgi:hypothetical protein
MKAERFFYSATGTVYLLVMLLGFHAFYTHGTGVAGRVISPLIFAVVLVHGLAITSWYVLFLTQAVLIAAKNRRLHMKLGWTVTGLGPLIVCMGTAVAIRSVQLAPPSFLFFGMVYSRFLLVMLTEVGLFALFVTAGVLARKKPRIHRPMMTLAGLALLPGATGRIPVLDQIFGMSGTWGLFGAIFVLGAALLLIRCALTRKFDPWFAGGYAVVVIACLGAEYLALTDVGAELASAILKV